MAPNFDKPFSAKTDDQRGKESVPQALHTQLQLAPQDCSLPKDLDTFHIARHTQRRSKTEANLTGVYLVKADKPQFCPGASSNPADCELLQSSYQSQHPGSTFPKYFDHASNDLSLFRNASLTHTGSE